MAVNLHPVRLQLDPTGTLHVEWSDGQRRAYTAEELYRNNPAADAKAEREAAAAQPSSSGILPVIGAEEAHPRQIAGVEAVGNYALSIRFNYGSNSGIYTFELLRRIGREEADAVS